MTAVTPEAVDAAAKVLMRGGTVQDMLEAAAPLIVAAALGGAGVPPEALAAACAARYGEPVDTYTWDRVAAAALTAGEPVIRAAERARCATVLAHVSPLDFLAAHGLKPGAAAGRVLVAAAAHILAPGGDGAAKVCFVPESAVAEAVTAERQRLAAVIPAARFRKLADWFDTDDEFKTTMFPETWPRRGHEVQDDLRKFAALLDGDGAGRPQDGPSTARAVPGGSGTCPDVSEPAETATAP